MKFQHSSLKPTVYQDNRSTIQLIKNEKTKLQRTKYLDNKYFVVRDRNYWYLLPTNRPKTVFVLLGWYLLPILRPRVDMAADVLTKGVEGSTLQRLLPKSIIPPDDCYFYLIRNLLQDWGGVLEFHFASADMHLHFYNIVALRAYLQYAVYVVGSFPVLCGQTRIVCGGNPFHFQMSWVRIPYPVGRVSPSCPAITGWSPWGRWVENCFLLIYDQLLWPTSYIWCFLKTSNIRCWSYEGLRRCDVWTTYSSLLRILVEVIVSYLKLNSLFLA
jgi:hypothetical protein